MSTARRVFPEVFKRSGLPMKFGFVDEHRHLWPVRVMCTPLGLSASGYYAWRSRLESPRAAANRVLLEDIWRIHGESSGTYGSPRVHAVLRRDGRRIGRSRIERLMRQAGLRGLAALPRRTRTTDSRHTYPIAPNRLGRNFLTSRPGQVWLADLTSSPLAKAGFTSPPYWICIPARSSAGRCARPCMAKSPCRRSPWRSCGNAWRRD